MKEVYCVVVIVTTLHTYPQESFRLHNASKYLIISLFYSFWEPNFDFDTQLYPQVKTDSKVNP